MDQRFEMTRLLGRLPARAPGDEAFARIPDALVERRPGADRCRVDDRVGDDLVRSATPEPVAERAGTHREEKIER